MDLNEWYFVEFDSDCVRLSAKPSDAESWTEEFHWDDIIRVCFNASIHYLLSDEIYIFIKQRPESYVIPTEASGGAELWGEIIRRGLFDAELAIKVTISDGGLFCCPPENSNDNS